MQFHFSNEPFMQQSGDTLLFLVPEDKEDCPQAWDPTVLEALERLRQADSFKGASATSAVLHFPSALPYERVIFSGLGKRGHRDGRSVRSAVALGAREARRHGARRVVCVLPDLSVIFSKMESDSEASKILLAWCSEAVLLGLYRFDGYKTQPESSKLNHWTFVLDTNEETAANEGLSMGQELASGIQFARDLVNEPPNELTPREFAQRAQRLAEKEGLECEVLDEEDLARKGMGALLAVGRGSNEPPRLVHLRWRPEQARRRIAFVGKGITFDTGGISLKPAQGMEEMKGDMAGAAAVLGAMQIIARRKPNVQVDALLCIAENMPSGRATRPGDVVQTMDGKTIEIVNTDAEGRLALADGVAYARRLGAEAIVDLATLTGAAIIALGHQAAILLGNDEEWVEEVSAAAVQADERVWRFPVYPEYKEQYKSNIADIKNVGGRPAGSITAGLIIGEFVGDTPWAHIDIAGVAWSDKDAPLGPVGGSGYGVRTLVELAERQGQGGEASLG